MKVFVVELIFDDASRLDPSSEYVLHCWDVAMPPNPLQTVQVASERERERGCVCVVCVCVLRVRVREREIVGQDQRKAECA